MTSRSWHCTILMKGNTQPSFEGQSAAASPDHTVCICTNPCTLSSVSAKTVSSLHGSEARMRVGV